MKNLIKYSVYLTCLDFSINKDIDSAWEELETTKNDLSIEIDNEEGFYSFGKSLYFSKYNAKNDEHKRIFTIMQSSPVLNKYNNEGVYDDVSKYENNIVNESQNKFPFCYFIVFLKNIPIGVINIYYLTGINNISFFFLVLTQYQGKGLGDLLIKSIINFIKKLKKEERYSFDKVKSIISLVDVKNKASLRIMEKNGFTLLGEGFFRKNYSTNFVLNLE